MLKGKTTIELTDVNTGEKKVYEHHNTITKSLEKLLKDHGSLMDPRYLFTSNGVSSLYPYRTNALGGLLLFDNEIDPKNGETIFAPTSASMVGCGVYNKTSTNNVRGSYNSTLKKLVRTATPFMMNPVRLFILLHRIVLTVRILHTRFVFLLIISISAPVPVLSIQQRASIPVRACLLLWKLLEIGASLNLVAGFVLTLR